MSVFKFFDLPFATDGDTTPIPDPSQGDGSVSFDIGYGVDYEADPDAPGVLYPERQKMNWLFQAITDALKQFQVHGFSDFVAAADNGGSPWSYDINAFVRWTDGNVYYSLSNANVATPADPTKWAMFNQATVSPFLTGDTIIWESNVLRTGGWVWANGQTIGSATSGATGRANADTSDLFTQIWTSFPNSVRPIQNSDGSTGTRGVSAVADFAANKRIPLRDMRDVVPAGLGTMGGTTDRGLLTGYRQGIDGTVFGNTGGEQAHTQAIDELVLHEHTFSASSNTGPGNGVLGTVNRQFNKITDPTGGGLAFNVVQPTTICNFITKL